MDVLNLVLAFMVVALHVGLFLDVDATLWYLTCNGLFRIAVPVFLIINGFYFHAVLRRGETKQWFRRALGLYLFWTAAYALLWFPALRPSLSGAARAVQILALGYFHLWYLSGMIGAALVVLWLRSRRSRTVCLVAVAMYCCGVAIQYAGNYHVFDEPVLDILSNTNWVHRNFLFFAFPFFYVGYAIHAHRLHDRVRTTVLCRAAAAGLVLLLLESYLNFTHPRNDGGYDNLATLIVACPVMFLIACKMKFQGANKHIALYSSGVFLVHVFVLNLLGSYVELGATAMTFAVMAASLAIAAALIPLSRKVRFVL